MAHCQPSLKISCKSVRKFLRKVANKQTYKQTDNDKNITSFTEVTVWISETVEIFLTFSDASRAY